MSNKSYREPVEITGSVYQINIESRTFKMKTDDGLRVKAPYTDETMHRVIEALKYAGERPLRVSGRGEFSHDGVLKRVVKSDRIIFAVPPREIDPNAPTIGDKIDARIATHPPEYWDQFPTNLVERHLAQRHGHCCQSE